MTQQMEPGLNLQHFEELSAMFNVEIQMEAADQKKKWPHFHKVPQCDHLDQLQTVTHWGLRFRQVWLSAQPLLKPMLCLILFPLFINLLKFVSVAFNIC